MAQDNLTHEIEARVGQLDSRVNSGTSLSRPTLGLNLGANRRKAGALPAPSQVDQGQHGGRQLHLRFYRPT